MKAHTLLKATLSRTYFTVINETPARTRVEVFNLEFFPPSGVGIFVSKEQGRDNKSAPYNYLQITTLKLLELSCEALHLLDVLPAFQLFLHDIEHSYRGFSTE